MIVHNVHSREYAASVEEIGQLLETLASDNDLLWPHHAWPPMVLSEGLNPSSAGGHGPMRYQVEAHVPLRSVRFRFTGPTGFQGTHAFFVAPVASGRSRLTHVVDLTLEGRASVAWSLVFRPLHDALLEEALDQVANRLTATAPQSSPYSPWVRLLRRGLTLVLKVRRHRPESPP